DPHDRRRQPRPLRAGVQFGLGPNRARTGLLQLQPAKSAARPVLPRGPRAALVLPLRVPPSTIRARPPRPARAPRIGATGPGASERRSRAGTRESPPRHARRVPARGLRGRLSPLTRDLDLEKLLAEGPV